MLVALHVVGIRTALLNQPRCASIRKTSWAFASCIYFSLWEYNMNVCISRSSQKFGFLANSSPPRTPPIPLVPNVQPPRLQISYVIGEWMMSVEALGVRLFERSRQWEAHCFYVLFNAGEIYHKKIINTVRRLFSLTTRCITSQCIMRWHLFAIEKSKGSVSALSLLVDQSRSESDARRAACHFCESELII